MQVDLLEICRDMVESYNVHFTCYSSKQDPVQNLDLGLRSHIFKNWKREVLWEKLTKVIEPCRLYDYVDMFDSEYVIFMLPDNAGYLMAGPWRRTYMDEYQLNTLVQENKIPMELMPELREYFQAVPLIYNYEAWMLFFKKVLRRLYGTDTCSEVCLLSSDALLSGVDYKETSQEQSLAVKMVEARYQIEADLLAAISTGNVDAAMKACASMKQYRTAGRYKNPVHDERNTLITANTLYRKAAERGYVHPVHIDELASRFAKQIETVCSKQDSDHLNMEMIRRYCMLVKNYSVRGYSPIIQKVLNHIDLKLDEDLSLRNLARIYTVNASYLSSMFKKELSMTITSYVTTQRIKKAILYLNTTDLQIQQIGAKVGIFDVNYFGKIFRRQTGMTPSEYREQVKNDSHKTDCMTR